MLSEIAHYVKECCKSNFSWIYVKAWVENVAVVRNKGTFLKIKLITIFVQIIFKGKNNMFITNLMQIVIWYLIKCDYIYVLEESLILLRNASQWFSHSLYKFKPFSENQSNENILNDS